MSLRVFAILSVVLLSGCLLVCGGNEVMAQTVQQEDIPTIAASEARSLSHGHSKVAFLDVRQPEEYEEGHIDGATSIPLNELPQRYRQLPNLLEMRG